MQKIPGIQKQRSFEPKKKMGSDAVTVGMKEYMHSPLCSGLMTAGVFGGTVPSLFKVGTLAVQNAPPFELKTIDSKVIRLIKIRYKAVHSRVDALFPCGASRSTTSNNSSNYLVACSRCLSKSTFLKPLIILRTLNEIPIESYLFTRHKQGRRDLPAERVRFICPANFPSDKENQDRIKAEMDYSANLLSATGSCEFSLPTWWLPNRDGTSDEGSGGK